MANQAKQPKTAKYEFIVDLTTENMPYKQNYSQCMLPVKLHKNALEFNVNASSVAQPTLGRPRAISRPSYCALQETDTDDYFSGYVERIQPGNSDFQYSIKIVTNETRPCDQDKENG